jgi:hypothetical protein
MLSGRVNSSYSTSETRRVTLVYNKEKNHKRPEIVGICVYDKPNVIRCQFSTFFGDVDMGSNILANHFI